MSLYTRCIRLALVGALALSAAAARAATITIDSLDGDITANEATSFINYVNAQTIGTSDLDNYMADGDGGTTVEACGRMYEATHNATILNLMIKWSEVFLSHRNDLPLGGHRVMWDGVVEPVWPSKSTTDAEAGYAGSENGDVVGHIAYAAYTILHNPSLWNTTVPDGNPNGYGVTYKQRAQTYVNMLDPGMTSYFTKWFINPTTSKFQTPTDSRWASKSGNETCIAWNRQLMFLNGYQRLAECHDILGDNPSFLSNYKLYEQVSCSDFLAHVATSTVSSHTVYSWGYDPTRNPVTQPESTGHGQYDIWGVFRAFNTNYTNMTAAQMQAFADTTEYVIRSGTASYSGNVDGSGSIANYLLPQYMFLAQFNQALYKQIAQDAINAGGRQSNSAVMSANILWMKHWLFINKFAGNYVLVSRNSAKAAVVQGASKTQGAAIIQFTNNGTTNSEWTLTSVGGDYYKLLNVNSGMALVVSGGDTANGAACVQWPYGGTATNDEWKIEDSGGGYVILINRNSRKVLDVSGGSTANGAVVDQWSWIGPTQEQWQIISAP